jgi:hypothetical protein
MFRTLPLIIILSTLIACHKKNSTPEYVKGDVLTGIKGNVPIDSVFAVFNRLGLQIKRVQNFTYAVPYPNDKLDSISAYLNTKPYIDLVNWKVQIAYNNTRQQTIYYSTFFNMDSANQADWLITINQLHLTDLHDTFTHVYLSVPQGSEQYWVDQLSKNSIIRWAELNQIYHVQL